MTTCTQATPIPVTSGAAVTGIDMTLSPLGQIVPGLNLLLKAGK